VISEYVSPHLDTLKVIGKKIDDSVISKINEFSFGDLQFDVYEGNGGHVRGETILDCKKQKIAFTGDNIVNIKGFSEDQQTFNKLAPYLMQSVNVDSTKATLCRNELTKMTSGYLICPGHGTWFENSYQH
jgi:glyoxylase-like metal-dependent hydrolase (beta-lactamase superfamily II)